MKNQEGLNSNGTLYGGSRAAKGGAALLGGHLRCRRCGSILHVVYAVTRPHFTPRYVCQGKFRHEGEHKCISFAAKKVDLTISEQIIEAVQPTAVTAALDAWEQGLSENNDTRRALQMSLEKAEYESELARRRFDKVDPDNRLVANQLERRWNDALSEENELRQRLELLATEDSASDEETRERLLQLADNVEEAWNHPAAPITLRKRIIKTVIREVVADISADPPEVLLWIHWFGGAHTHLKVRKNKTGVHSRSTDRDVVELIEELAKVCRDKDTAAILNRLGYRTGPGETWTSTRVCAVRNYRKISPMPPKADRPWVTLYEAAETLRIAQASVRKLIKQGIIEGKQVGCYAPWVIPRKELSRKKVKEAADRIRRPRRAAQPSPDQQELRFKT